MFVRKRPELVKQPLERCEIVTYNHQEPVNKHFFEVMVGSGNAAKKSEKCFGTADPVFLRIDEPDGKIQIKHVPIVIVDKHDASLCFLCRGVGKFQNLLGLARSLFPENDLYHDSTSLCDLAVLYPTFPLLSSPLSDLRAAFTLFSQFRPIDSTVNSAFPLLNLPAKAAIIQNDNRKGTRFRLC